MLLSYFIITIKYFIAYWDLKKSNLLFDATVLMCFSLLELIQILFKKDWHINWLRQILITNCGMRSVIKIKLLAFKLCFKLCFQLQRSHIKCMSNLDRIKSIILPQCRNLHISSIIFASFTLVIFIRSSFKLIFVLFLFYIFRCDIKFFFLKNSCKPKKTSY